MLRALAICALAMAVAPAFAGDGSRSLEVLQSCYRDIDDDAHGIIDLEKSCDGLRAALDDLHLTERLHGGWERTIDRDVLGALTALQIRYSGEPSRKLRKEPLQKSLDDLKLGGGTERLSWWERFKSWLRQLATPEQGDSPEWLERLLEKLTFSDAVLRGIVYGLVILVVGMAIGVVVVELRAAGVFGRRAKSGQGETPGLAPEHTAARVSLSDVDAASWRDRPALLLRLLVQRLVELKRLQTERSLTHRELSRRTRFQSAVDRERFERLSTLAERMRFGVRTEREEHDQRAAGVLAEARALFDELRPEQPS